jgi:hypothetical protein
VELVGRESAGKPRLEDVTAAALPKVEDHLTTLRVQLGGSCLALTSETVGALPPNAATRKKAASLTHGCLFACLADRSRGTCGRRPADIRAWLSTRRWHRPG